MTAGKNTALVVHGWTVFAHPLFTDQVDALARQVQALKQKDPTGYVQKNATKRLAAIAKPGVPNPPRRRWVGRRLVAPMMLVGRTTTLWGLNLRQQEQSAFPLQPLDFCVERAVQFCDQGFDVAHLMLNRQHHDALRHAVVNHEVLPRSNHQKRC